MTKEDIVAWMETRENRSAPVDEIAIQFLNTDQIGSGNLANLVEINEGKMATFYMVEGSDFCWSNPLEIPSEYEMRTLKQYKKLI